MDNWDFLDEDFEKEIFEDNFTVIIIYDIISTIIPPNINVLNLFYIN